LNVFFSRILSFFFITAVLLQSACASKTAIVYEAKGDKQCEQGGLSLQQSSRKLMDAGISVTQSFCGKKTGFSVMTMCGGSTNNILLHSVAETEVEQAKSIGFQPIEKLATGDSKGYETISCNP